ncbi:hypothetical protein B484DRAFT_417217 [Ochromonadaceae sp. CCMP2298]|nr:hypothetical protein B484DRAFT_417217 [Ochromonadaceae sp. CCMP2298]
MLKGKGRGTDVLVWVKTHAHAGTHRIVLLQLTFHLYPIPCTLYLIPYTLYPTYSVLYGRPATAYVYMYKE